ncbi:MAG: T9SS type A sorting domain-containing protein [Bacteroidia bacterium]
MKKYIFTHALAFILSMPLASAQFVNGDFQTPLANTIGDCNAGDSWLYSSPSTGGTGEPQYTDYVVAGDFFIDLTPCWSFGNEVWIEQAVNIPSIKCYVVQMDLMTVCGWDLSDAGVFVNVDGVPIGTRVFTDSFDCVSGEAWKTCQSAPFHVNNAGTHTIRFTGLGLLQNGQVGNPGVMGLDNISLVPVSSCQTSVEVPELRPFSVKLSSNPLQENPSLFVSSKEPRALSVSLLNTAGKYLYQAEILAEKEEKQYFLPSNLPQGFYLLQINDGKKIWSEKVIYEN